MALQKNLKRIYFQITPLEIKNSQKVAHSIINKYLPNGYIFVASIVFTNSIGFTMTQVFSYKPYFLYLFYCIPHHHFLYPSPLKNR